jgi:hypothetical protein
MNEPVLVDFFRVRPVDLAALRRHASDSAPALDSSDSAAVHYYSRDVSRLADMRTEVRDFLAHTEEQCFERQFQYLRTHGCSFEEAERHA